MGIWDSLAKNWRERLMKRYRKEEPPSEGQLAIVGQNRYVSGAAQYTEDGRMLAYRLDDVTIRDLDRVRQDPVVKSSLRLLKLPILRCKWQVYSEDEKIQAFVQEALRPHIRTYLWAMLNAFDFGVAFIETVWKHQDRFEVTSGRGVNPSAQVYRFTDVWVIDSVAHLDPSLSWALVYPTGEFAGVRQLQGGGDIPEGRLLHFALDAEYNEVYGNPIIKAAIPYVELKVRAFDDLARYYATFAVPTKKGFAPPGRTPIGVDEDGNPITVDNVQYLAEELDKLTTHHAIVMPSMTDEKGNRLWDVEAFSVPAPTNYESYIQLLDEQIRQSMGVPALASVRPVAGSYALGQAQIDMFIQNEEAWLEQIEDALNRDVVQRLTRYNFGARAAKTYIELSINRAELQRLIEGLVQLLSANQPIQVDGGVLVADWQKIAQDLGIPYRIQAPQMDGMGGFGGMGGFSGMGGFGGMKHPPFPYGNQEQQEETDDDANAQRNGADEMVRGFDARF